MCAKVLSGEAVAAATKTQLPSARRSADVPLPGGTPGASTGAGSGINSGGRPFIKGFTSVGANPGNPVPPGGTPGWPPPCIPSHPCGRGRKAGWVGTGWNRGSFQYPSGADPGPAPPAPAAPCAGRPHVWHRWRPGSNRFPKKALARTPRPDARRNRNGRGAPPACLSELVVTLSG